MEGNEEKFIHPELNAQVIAIGGNYIFTQEKRILYRERDVLYYIGVATFDTTCCGAGGCAYAFVPGYIVQWKTGNTAEGQPISLIELIKEKEDQKNNYYERGFR